jgi:hypothetical protein
VGYGNQARLFTRQLDPEQAIPLHPTLGAEAGTTASLARLFKKLSLSHFFLDATAFYEFPKAADSLLDAFTFTNRQLDHAV